MLDLFCGLGGFSQEFRKKGCEITTVDIEKDFRPDILADIEVLAEKHFFAGQEFDIVLASPPCTDFSKASMPWYKNINPNMSLLEATIGILADIKPRYWIIENVRGAIPFFQPYMGSYKQHCGSRYLWGNFPKFPCEHKLCYGKWLLGPGKHRSELRAKIPEEISKNLYIIIME